MSHCSFIHKTATQALLIATALVGSISAPAPAQAGTIKASDLTDGATSVTLPDFATITASVRTFRSKNIAALPDFRGVGIAGGYVPAEIDAQDNEAINIQFADPEGEKIESFDLAFLFERGPSAYGDTANEVAIVTPTGSTSGFLSVIDDTTARWQFGSITSDAVNLSVGNRTGAGAWRVLNPFGDVATQSVRFSAPPNGRSGTDPDYSLLQITTAPKPRKVPEPTALLGLLTIAALGAGSLKKGKLVSVEVRNS